jgi:hypothetical protein
VPLSGAGYSGIALIRGHVWRGAFRNSEDGIRNSEEGIGPQ